MLLDTHFQQRDRMGRLVAFLARIAQAGEAVNVRGVSCDEQSVILVEENLQATLAAQTSGPDHVCYFLSTVGVPQVCEKNTPLTFENITVFRGTPGTSTFDFNTWTGYSGAQYTIFAKQGVLGSSQPGGSVY